MPKHTRHLPTEIEFRIARAAADMRATEQHTCSICRQIYTGFGNNAWPVNDGRCCDQCNKTVVIPARAARRRGEG